MNPMNKTIYVDCDGVLLLGHRINHTLVSKLHRMQSEGWDLVVWSARGREYAQVIASQSQLFRVTCIGKPTIMIDDRPADLLRYCKVLSSRSLVDALMDNAVAPDDKIDWGKINLGKVCQIKTLHESIP